MRGNLLAAYQGTRSLIARHMRLLPFASTMVVLGTFIINDALKSDAKDLADSIAAAQTTFAIRADIKVLGTKLESIDDKLTNTSILVERLQRFHIPDNYRPTPTESKYESEIDAAQYDRNTSVLWSQNFDNAMNLYARLPYDRFLDEQHWALIIFNNAYKNYFEGADVLSQDFHSGDMKGAEEAYGRVTAERQIIEQTRKGMLLAFKVPPIPWKGVDPLQLFSASVVKRAQEVREKADAKAKTWRNFSFVLYPLGLVLGLIGKMDDEAPEAEA